MGAQTDVGVETGPSFREREARLRRRFGPPAPTALAPIPRRRRRRWPAGIVVAAILGLAALGWNLAPRGHTAPGCWWWTAANVRSVRPGDQGCLRGYFEPGSNIGDGPNASFTLPLMYSGPNAIAHRPPCDFQVGDAIVVRYRAVNDGGQTRIVVVACR